MIQERVRAGLRRAVDEGKQLGRPRIDPALEQRIRDALKAGETIRGVAAKFNVNPSTVQRIKALSSPPREAAPLRRSGARKSTAARDHPGGFF